MKSTKKSGVPPKADKTKSKGGKPKPTGNEAGVKFQNKNKDVTPPPSTGRSHGKDKKFDRHSRTGRSETAKAEKMRLGDEVEAQIEAEEDAKAEAEGDEEEEPKQQLRSAADFFAELESSEFQKSKAAAAPASEINAEDLLVKETEEFIPSKTEKKVKEKAKKTKVYLDIDVTVADYVRPERIERSERSDNRKPRGGKKFAGKPKPAEKKSLLNDKNFPAL